MTRNNMSSAHQGVCWNNGRQAKQVELKDLRREVAGFARIMREYDIVEMELETEGLVIKLRSESKSSPPRSVEVGVEAISEDSHITITAPMVGTFYKAPAPDEAPYVRVGDTVLPGQTLCIIEAMKTMNEIQSEVRGRIVEILTENAEPVEYGQPLFILETL
ncbi:MAG: acetyl-CoA carboxylase biotin carboxyl carrier protein [Firmicutes bacterium]|nr:acetyl-CoA carboxylase biotin carboxyl carrier protein [Bacillota bacterium]